MTEHYIKRAQAGDSAAWNFLYRHHYPWMHATALRICGDSAAAKDAVQDTFITAYLKLQQLKDPMAFAGWLKVILAHTCQRNAQQQLLPPDIAVFFKNRSFYDDEINKVTGHYESQTKMYNSLSCLSDTLQSVLLLRYFSNWSSYEQIAAMLCIPVGTVRSRLNQAKQKLVEHWERSNGDVALRRATEWNNLYNEYFGSVYTSLQVRERLINHFDKNLVLTFTSGKKAFGRNIVQQLIEDDLTYGNSFAGLEVNSSSHISIIECRNINPDDHPDRCPDSLVFVLHRTGNVVTAMNIHNS